jgi:ABC-2 type transport system ATP-binding protein
VLEVHKICKSYGNKQVLQDLSFTIKSGEVYGLLGPNGAGKTTMISVLCGLIQSDRGTVALDGQPISGATRSLIGVAPQESIFYKNLTCEENLLFFGHLYGLSNQICKEQARSCLELVGLSDRAKSIADKLSGGMQRRLSMAIALVHRPKLVILDEPTTGLDIESRYEVWELICKLRGQDAVILLTTHMLEEAERLCQRIGIIKNGNLLAEGTLEELRKYVPAQEIAIISTRNEDLAIARATKLGFSYRRYGRDLAFWLPRTMELKEILEHFEGIPIESIIRQPIRLENIYIEVTQCSIHAQLR